MQSTWKNTDVSVAVIQFPSLEPPAEHVKVGARRVLSLPSPRLAARFNKSGSFASSALLVLVVTLSRQATLIDMYRWYGPVS